MNRTTWDTALADYRSKQQASDADPHNDDLTNACCRAMDLLIEEIPAPDWGAVWIKLSLAEERYEGHDIDRKAGHALLSDVHRLGGSIGPRAWDAALADYLTKRVHSAVMPLGTEGEDEAVDAYCVSFDRLVEDTPAPTVAELAIKLELAFARWGESGAFPDETAAALVADARRLSATDPLRQFAEAWLDRWTALGGTVGISSEGRRFKCIPEPDFWTPPSEHHPALQPHQWVTNPADHRGAVRALEGLLALVPGGSDAVWTLAVEKGLALVGEA